MARRAGELFELEILGGNTERRFRKMRPEVEEMPWGTMDLSGAPPERLIEARKAWTGAAYQEHRTAAACAITLRALIEARAPLDLIAVASRFPLDEMVHVELCARMAMEMGGGTEIIHDPDAMVLDVNPEASPLMRAAECAVRFFCVGEAISIPLLRATWHVAKHPLPRAVMGRIVKDEAAHGVFGFTFLDWALPRLSEQDRRDLGASADLAIRFLERQWDHTRRHRREPVHDGDVLGWMKTDDYLALAEQSMETLVLRPLLARGIPVMGRTPEAVEFV
ncbi:MAG: hypothetical protein MUF64_02410 [Polyangiaceae bacterium]|jgi:hypothetical protein|nr:hypothetical protein [Polyangiaceae bacterium]